MRTCNAITSASNNLIFAEQPPSFYWSFPIQRLHKFWLLVLLTTFFLIFIPFFSSANDNTPELSIIDQARQLHRDAKTQELLSLVEPLVYKGTFQNQERFEVLNMIVQAYLFQGDLETADKLNKKMQLQALYGENNLYLGKSYLNEAEISQKQGLLNGVLELQRQALSYFKKAKNKDFIANASLEISYTLVDMNLNVESLNYANQSLAIGKEIKSVKTIASAYHSIARIHENLGNYAKALEAHQKKIQLDMKRGDISKLSTSYFNVASIFSKMNDYEQAEFYANEALKLNLEGGNLEFLGHDYSSLADLALRMDNPSLSKEYALLSMQIFEKSDAIVHQGLVHNLLAKANHKLGNTELANTHIKKGIEINLEIDNSQQLTQSYIFKSEMLFDKGKLNDALKLIEGSLPIPIKHSDFDQIKTLFMLKSRVFEAMDEHEKALAAYKDYYQLKDDFELENRSNILMQLQNQMDFLYKDHQIQLLESRSSIRQLQLVGANLEKNLWIVGLLLFICLATAVLYRERTKRHIAAIERQLLADSIEQKNSMLAEVAHELRSPLTALKLQVEVLQYNLEEDPEAAYKRLNNKVAELNKLIEDLYDLARADNGLLKLNMENVSVQDLVEDIIDGYHEVVEHKGLQLKTEVDIGDAAHFIGDSLRIKQVIVNLIRNSINYTNAPGTISCTAQTHDEHCEIILEDSAPGVSSEDIPRLFERMYRADSTRDKHQSGSGLGLSICKSLVEAHKGKILASSSVLGGLKVRIVLPKSQSTIPDLA